MALERDLKTIEALVAAVIEVKAAGGGSAISSRLLSRIYQ